MFEITKKECVDFLDLTRLSLPSVHNPKHHTETQLCVTLFLL